MKRVTMSFAASLTYKPEHPERTAKKSGNGLDGTIIDWSIDRNLEILGVYKLQQVSKISTTNRKTGVNKINSLQVAR